MMMRSRLGGAAVRLLLLRLPGMTLRWLSGRWCWCSANGDTNADTLIADRWWLTADF